MKNLSRFTPAETLLILQGTNASYKELVKFTFLDLLIKNVLRTIEIPKESNPKEKDYKYVITGKNYLAYRSKPHENIFIEPFNKNNSLQILFRNIVKIGYQNAKSERKFCSLIIQNPGLENLFTKGFFEKLFGGFTCTETCMQFRSAIESEIAKLEIEMKLYLSDDTPKALSVLKAVGANIFFLKN